MPQLIPEELSASTPPRVHATDDAGSGPSLRPYLARTELTATIVAPGWTRTLRPPSSTSMPRKDRRVSTMTPFVKPCPDRLVPPERKLTATLWRLAAAMAAATSEVDPARTRTLGVSR